MALLGDIYIKASVLRTLADTVERKGEKGVALTISVNDETDNYGQNITAYVSQSKEQREAKTPKFYAGNGKVFWSDGNPPVVAVKKEQAHTPKKEYKDDSKTDELPF